MTDTHARHMIRVLPSELQPGDQIRDCGIDRTIATVLHDPNTPGVMQVDEVRFEPVDGYPTRLGIEATVTVTAWRTS